VIIVIEMTNIRKRYAEKTVFDKISFCFDDKKIYALVGVNGAGKTTFLNLITQSDCKDSGEVRVDGVNNEEFDSKYNYFYVPDRADMFLNLTGIEYINFISRIYEKNSETPGGREEVGRLLSLLKIEDGARKELRSCSLGTKRKIYITGALVSGAGNLIFDESFNGLDHEMSLVARSLLSEHRDKGGLVLYSMHNLDMVANFSDEVVFIGRDGRLISVSNTQNIKELENLFFEKCVER
jgi:ABC-2 type transport system ATP-binding protein